MQIAASVMASAGGLTSLRDRLVKRGIWVFAGRCGGVAAQFALQLLLARLLSLYDYGVYVLLTSIVIPASTVAMLGFNRLAVKLIAATLAQSARERLDAVLRLLATGSSISIIAVSVVAGVVLRLALPHFLPELDAWWVAPLIALWIALLAGHQLLAEMLRGFHELRYASLVMGQSGGPVMNVLLVATLLLAASVTTASLPLTLVATVVSLGLLLPLVVRWLIVTARCHGWQRSRPGVAAEVSDGLSFRAVSGTCLMLVVGQVLLFAVNQGDVWISGWLLEPTDAAILGAARRLVLVAVIPSFLVNMTVLSCIPDLHAQGRLMELQQVLRSSATVATLLSLVLFVPLILIPGYCLRVVYTPQYESGAPIVMVLALSNLVYTLFGSSQLALQLGGREKYAALIQLVASCLLFGVGPLVAQRFGITALACVSSVTLAAVYVASWLAVRWSLGIWTHPHLVLRIPSVVNRQR